LRFSVVISMDLFQG